jgi:hypothetical protein
MAAIVDDFKSWSESILRTSFQVTILLPAFLYTSYNWSCCYIVLIFIQGVWNGASYYIEVFSKRCGKLRFSVLAKNYFVAEFCKRTRTKIH